ncbi:MAG: phosphomannomutase [Sphingobacteriales bacterium]
MTLIKSISGIRGTIGGKVNEGLTPVDVVRFTAAFGTWLIKRNPKNKTIVIGRDARISGPMVSQLVCSTLQALGLNVIDLGLSTTPTVELAVPNEKAIGGIILTASHNPKQWNALKLLNGEGEFISGKDGSEVLALADKEAFNFSGVDDLGQYKQDSSYFDFHINHVQNLRGVDFDLVKKKKFKIVVDGVNSSGGIIVPQLLKAMGVEVVELYCEPTGHFPHNPEPLPENITAICQEVVKTNADLGIIVDPDVDRLAFVDEQGQPFGEEFTLVAVADYVLGLEKGNAVSNLSSTKALKEIVEKHGGKYFASAVGEVNVVTKMKENNALIGGEGNGGIIYPESHYGRDALVGIGLFLTHLAIFGKSTSMLRAKYPNYVIAKNKISLTDGIDVDGILKKLKKKYLKEQIDTTDGVKIIFAEGEWVHLRKSNTEPIIRIYAESNTETQSESLGQKLISDIKELM